MDEFDVVGSNMVQALSEPETFDVSLQTYLSDKLSNTVFPGHIPQSATLPAYSYFRLEEDAYYTLGAAAGLTSVVYQVDCWSTDYLDCSVMQTALRNALHGFRGYMGSTLVTSSRLRNTQSITEPNIDYYTNGTLNLVGNNQGTGGTPSIGWDGTYNTTYRNMQGYAAEIIIYNRVLTDPERVEVEGYLMAKWLNGVFDGHFRI